MSSSPEIDIMLLLEGTYPYVKGGVSAWVHDIIRGLPQYRFGVVFLGAREDDYPQASYTLPDNVVHMQRHYLFDAPTSGDARGKRRRRRLDHTAVQAMAAQHARPGHACPALPDSRALLDPSSPLSDTSFYDSQSAWQYLTERYEDSAEADSFLDYFWTVRNVHAPLWQLARLARDLPPARMLFSPSTGYAGWLGALHARESGRPFVLMEHGIYTRERRIDLLKATWIRDRRNFLQVHPAEVSHLREIWIRFFETTARQTYDQASRIISLFERARQQQLRDGAAQARTAIIPNGVDVPSLAGLRRAADAAVPPVMCLIGRVVPIKDIKNFIRAAALARQSLPGLQAWIVGPDDEDPAYAMECRELARSLALTDTVRFTGFQLLKDVLPKVGVLVLSSVSEGLPLSVLEGFAAGIPAVTTDVGACRELIEGSGGDDDVPGHAGAVVGLADPEALANAVSGLLGDREAYLHAVETAVARVTRRYGRERMLGAFQQLFEEAMG